MSTTLRKWGNSLGIRLPKAIAEQLKLTSGTEVEFDTGGGVLTIRPIRPRKYKLADLLDHARGPSPHRQLMNDAPRGRELL